MEKNNFCDTCSVSQPSHYTLVHFFIHNNLSRIAVSNFLKMPYTFFQFNFSAHAFLNKFTRTRNNPQGAVTAVLKISLYYQ